MYVSFKYNRANNETDQSPLQAYEKDFQKDNENNKPWMICDRVGG